MILWIAGSEILVLGCFVCYCIISSITEGFFMESETLVECGSDKLTMLFEEHVITNVIKKDIPTHYTTEEVQKRSFTEPDGHVVNSTKIVQHDNIKHNIITYITIDNERKTINNDIDVSSGMHIRTVHLKYNGKIVSSIQSVYETGYLFGQCSPSFYIRNNVLDGANPYNPMAPKMKFRNVDSKGRYVYDVITDGNIEPTKEEINIIKSLLFIILIWLIFYFRNTIDSFLIPLLSEKLYSYILKIKSYPIKYYKILLGVLSFFSLIRIFKSKKEMDRIADLNRKKKQGYIDTHPEEFEFKRMCDDKCQYANEIAGRYLNVRF